MVLRLIKREKGNLKIEGKFEGQQLHPDISTLSYQTDFKSAYLQLKPEVCCVKGHIASFCISSYLFDIKSD